MTNGIFISRISSRTMLKQGMYGGKPAAKRILIITPSSLVKVQYSARAATLPLRAISNKSAIFVLELGKRDKEVAWTGTSKTVCCWRGPKGKGLAAARPTSLFRRKRGAFLGL